MVAALLVPFEGSILHLSSARSRCTGGYAIGVAPGYPLPGSGGRTAPRLWSSQWLPLPAGAPLPPSAHRTAQHSRVAHHSTLQHSPAQTSPAQHSIAKEAKAYNSRAWGSGKGPGILDLGSRDFLSRDGRGPGVGQVWALGALQEREEGLPWVQRSEGGGGGEGYLGGPSCAVHCLPCADPQTEERNLALGQCLRIHTAARKPGGEQVSGAQSGAPHQRFLALLPTPPPPSPVQLGRQP